MNTTSKAIANISTVAPLALILIVFVNAAIDTGDVSSVDSPEPDPYTGLAVVPTLEDMQRAAQADRDAVLAMVNVHRRGASLEWRQRLAEAIYNESREAGVDPLMVAAIVAKESSFKSRVVSHAGAVGLMQLRPFVARDVARRGQIEWNGVSTLHHPDLNVRLGILYYKELVVRFDGDHHVALTAYNQGPTRVSRNMRRGTYSGSAYATDILGMYQSVRNESGGEV